MSPSSSRGFVVKGSRRIREQSPSQQCAWLHPCRFTYIKALLLRSYILLFSGSFSRYQLLVRAHTICHSVSIKFIIAGVMNPSLPYFSASRETAVGLIDESRNVRFLSVFNQLTRESSDRLNGYVFCAEICRVLKFSVPVRNFLNCDSLPKRSFLDIWVSSRLFICRNSNLQKPEIHLQF